MQKDKIEEKDWEREELDAFLTATLKHGLRLDKERFYTLAFSGLPVGELCALKKSDLDLENNIISVTKTINSKNDNMREYDITTPKNDISVRKVEMEKPIMDMLRDLIRRNDTHKMKYRLQMEDFHDGDFVFSRENGYPYFGIDVNSRINRMLKKAKINRHASSHIFRHTHISMLTEAGIDLPTIMNRVGHKGPKTTLEIYTHVTNKMMKKASEKINHAYGDLLENISLLK
ncbi:site-specific integrase [Virgibacillus litoralis]|uniref:Integrase n=1 Tax=Virgibacillus litoralis TaxID=578221 RepID=A0ABS4HCB8_9BACI|nr:site-specific integrase [Virgibacillus litoralis]MBP1948483.1 integrase [Virgibacillus litoralis]